HAVCSRSSFASEAKQELCQERGGRPGMEVGSHTVAPKPRLTTNGCRLVRRSDADWCAASALTVELRLYVLRVTVGADAVSERRCEALLDIALERLPFVALVPDPLAVRTNGKEPLELLQLPAEAQDALRDSEPGLQLVRVHRLGDEVVGPGLHGGEVLLFAAARRDENEIDVGLVATRPHTAT